MNIQTFSINQQLPWRNDAANIPNNRPVLVKIKTSHMPFMASRDDEFIDCHLEANHKTYGFARELTDVEFWLDVTAV